MNREQKWEEVENLLHQARKDMKEAEQELLHIEKMFQLSPSSFVLYKDKHLLH